MLEVQVQLVNVPGWLFVSNVFHVLASLMFLFSSVWVKLKGCLALHQVVSFSQT